MCYNTIRLPSAIDLLAASSICITIILYFKDDLSAMPLSRFRVTTCRYETGLSSGAAKGAAIRVTAGLLFTTV
jgi:hypothetical protein